MLPGTSTQATDGLRTSTKNITSLENLTASCQRTIQSQTMDIFGIIFFTIAFAYMTFVVAIESRFFVRRFLSRRWPTATATIRAESFGTIGKGARAAFFTYDFTVEEVTYTGRFALNAFLNEDQGKKLLNELTGLPISIRYNPKQPKISFLVNVYDLRFDGATGTQNPNWYIERREIPGDTIKLFQK